MNSTGIVRRVDELGRIVLPIELRRTLNIKEKDQVEIITDGNKIILSKFHDTDIFTGSTEDLIEYKGQKISIQTIKELAELIGLKV